MGVFDVPAPVFAWLDGLMGEFAPPAARLMLWGVVSAAISMGLYWLISPQQKIAQTKERALEARRALDRYEGDFAGAWPRMREMLRLSLMQVGIVTWPAIAASLPVLCVLVWMSAAYGYHFPPSNADPEIRVFPERIQARWVGGGQAEPRSAAKSRSPRIQLLNSKNKVTTEFPLPEPVPTLHKRQWWNLLFGNPAGYLPEGARVGRIEIGLPEQTFLTFGPAWMRSWEFLYLIVLVLGSIVIKVAFRIT